MRFSRHTIAFIVLICYATIHSVQNKASTTFNQKTADLIEKNFPPPASFSLLENSVKISIPKKEAIKIEGKIINPFMGLSSLLFFQKGSKPNVELMAMGDVVMLKDEVQQTIQAALENGIELSALHNHCIGEEPTLYFMHFNIEGDANKVITSLKKMVSALEKPSAIIMNQPKEAPSSIDATNYLIPIFATNPTESKNGMHKFTFNRPFRAKCNCIVDKGMGVASWAAFQGTDNDAIMTGDFALVEDEVQAVLQSLAKDKIKVFAIHNHMLQEQPRLISLHFFATGKVADLAQSFKNALSLTKTPQQLPPQLPHKLLSQGRATASIKY